MDALSKIFDDIHLNKSEFIYLKPQGDWAYRYQEADAMIGYVVLAGQMMLQLESSQPLQLEAGDLLLIPSGQKHICSSQHPSNLVDVLNISGFFKQKTQETIAFGSTTGEASLILAIHCHIDTIMARPLLNALPDYIHIPHIAGSHTPEWLQIGLHFLALEVHQVRPGRDKILDHLVSILFIECVRDYIAQLQDSSNWLRALAHTELANALAAIHGHPEQAWTVERLAAQCCMSRSKFATLFSQMVGETPLAYLQQYRFRLACQHLREGLLSIQQIAPRVGYSSETAFSQTFKRLFDLTPSQYRQQFQQVTPY